MRARARAHCTQAWQTVRQCISKQNSSSTRGRRVCAQHPLAVRMCTASNATHAHAHTVLHIAAASAGPSVCTGVCVSVPGTIAMGTAPPISSASTHTHPLCRCTAPQHTVQTKEALLTLKQCSPLRAAEPGAWRSASWGRPQQPWLPERWHPPKPAPRGMGGPGKL